MSQNQSTTEGSAQKNKIIDVRREFFNELKNFLAAPPTRIDEIMGQASFFIPPDFAFGDGAGILEISPEAGTFAVSVTPLGPDSPSLRFIHSMFMAGDWIRYGVLLQGPPRLLASYGSLENHDGELIRLWDRPCDQNLRDDSGILMEWRFSEPMFYSDYVIRERFLKMARHLHFRMGRSVLSVLQTTGSSS